MKIARFARRTAVDETDLRQAGFTVDEIVHLSKLRDSYLVLGDLGSRREIQWLSFIKWCLATGRLRE